MLRIGIISDTHGVFDEPLRKFLSEVDEIWHAGDFGTVETADAIAAFKPLVGVRGNIDGGATRLQYPDHQLFTREGSRILMKHIVGTPLRYDMPTYALVQSLKPTILVAGHSHILRVEFDRAHNLMFINPGAAGCHGFHRVRTALRLTLDGARLRDLEVGEWSRG